VKHSISHGETDKSRSDAVDSHALPVHPVAMRLAYAGLLPFVLGALLVWLIGDHDLDAHAFVSLALSAIAALTIAFLGGIHWGLALRQPVAPVLPSYLPFAWGVAPSLIAWPALMMPAYAGLVVHGVMLVVCYLVDRRLYPAYGAANWLTLRFRLSAVAALACFVAAAGS
jgi:hypothetical protein